MDASEFADCPLRHLDAGSRSALVRDRNFMRCLGAAPLGWSTHCSNGRKYFVNCQTGERKTMKSDAGFAVTRASIDMTRDIRAYDKSWDVREWHGQEYCVHRESGFWHLATPADNDRLVQHYVAERLAKRHYITEFRVILPISLLEFVSVEEIKWAHTEEGDHKVMEERKALLEGLAILSGLPSFENNPCLSTFAMVQDIEPQIAQRIRGFVGWTLLAGWGSRRKPIVGFMQAYRLARRMGFHGVPTKLQAFLIFAYNGKTRIPANNSD